VNQAVVVVLVTVPDEEVGTELGRRLVDERLAACVNVVTGVRSVYRWRGAVEEAGECLLVAKLRAAGLAAFRDRVVELHPYDLPEVLALPVADGLEPYLGWVVRESTPAGGS
jgi:periplasmic divalent cation tolerance protein